MKSPTTHKKKTAKVHEALNRGPIKKQKYTLL